MPHPPHTCAVIELHYMALWGSHYSLWLICNDWLSSTSRAKMGLSLIVLKLEEKKQRSAKPLHSNPSYIYFNTNSSSSVEHTIDQAWVFVLAVCTQRVCVGWRWTAWSLYFYILALVLLASVYPSCVEDPSTLTGLLCQHSSHGSGQQLAQRYRFQLEKHS